MLRKFMGSWITTSQARAILLGSALMVSAAGIGGVVAQEATQEPTQNPPVTQNANRGYLGISIADTDGSGARVVEIVADAPAAETDLAVGDVITAVNGTAVSNGRELSDAIAALSIDDVVTLDVWRGDETFTVEVTLGEYPASLMGRPGRGERRGQRNFPDGMQFQFDMNGTSLAYSDAGWELLSIGEDSPLADTGLQVGDVITAVDGQSVDPAALSDYLSDLDAEEVELTVTRGEEMVTVTVSTDVLKSLLAPMGRGFSFSLPGNRGDFLIPDGGNLPNVMPFHMGMFGNGRLGLTFVTLDEQVAEERGVEQTDGALVVEVIEGSPAADAGLQADDVITAVNGEPVDAERTLRDRLIAYEPDDVVTLTVQRGGEELSVEVTLGQPVMMEGMPFGDMMEGMMPGMPFHFFMPDVPQPATPPVQPNV